LTRLRLLRERLRRRLGGLAAEGFFAGLSHLGRLHPQARPERHHVEVLRDIPYLASGADEHLLDVYRPTRTPGPWPVVLYVHGGGFRILSKDTHWVMGLGFARRGYLVFNISYRLAPRHRFPAAVEDACAALRWVAQHAPSYGGDLGRLVLAGESAGANLVTSLTLAGCYPRPEPFARAVWDLGLAPRATLAACGLLQVSDSARFARRKKLHPWIADRIIEVAEAYIGSAEAPPSPELELADPLLVLERGEPPARPLPAFFAPVGTKDPVLDDTRRLKAALDRLGVPNDVRYYEGEAHAFHALVFRENARRCWGHMFRFLERHL
jgi:acetyl esterase